MFLSDCFETFFLLPSKTPRILWAKFIARTCGRKTSHEIKILNPVQPKSRVVVGPIECRASNFYGELTSMKNFKCKTDYGILKCEHVERYASRRVKNDKNAKIELECTYSGSI